ncbi:hypothetical protein ABPG73_015273 [Tetrahymena malaccensis]
MLLFYFKNFFLAFYILKGFVQQEIQQVYSSFFASELNQANCQIPLSYSIQIAKQQGLIFVSCGVDGISIIDYLGTQILQTIQFNGTQIQNFQISNNGQVLFLTYNSTIYTYELTFVQKPFESFKMVEVSLIQKIDYIQFISQFIYINELELLIVSGQNGLITSYNTTQRSSIQSTGYIQIDVQYINGLFLSPDYQYLFVGAYYDGMQILKLNYNLDVKNNKQNSTSFNQVGMGVVGYCANFCQATQDFYVYCYDQWTGLYYANAQQLLKNNNENIYPINFPFVYYWPEQQNNPTIMSLAINSQETILFIGSSCYTDFEDNYLFGSFDEDGLFVFPIFKNPYRLNTQNYKNYPIIQDSLDFDQGGNYILVPQYYQGIILSIYQYAPLDNSQEQQNISPMNMKLVKTYNNDTPNYSEYIAFSVDRSFAVQAVQEFLIIYNSINIFDMQILSIWQKPDFLQGDLFDVAITPNNQWIIGLILGQGYIVLDISNKTNPVLVNYLKTFSGNTLLISAYYNLAYLAEGSKGFGIIDISFLPQIKYISRLSIPGYSYMLLPLQKEDYILITQSDKGLLTLIDIRNKESPIIINTILYLNQHAQAVCSCRKLSYLFITISDGILTIPFKSDVQIHTEVALIKQSINSISTQKLRQNRQNFTLATNQTLIANEYIFQVGQTIVLDFTILYPINLQMIISQVYTYKDNNIENLPSYFVFDSQQNQLQMQIKNDLLGLNNVISNLIIILIRSSIPLDSTSFVYQSQDQADLGITNSTQSALIYQYLMDQNIINLDGTVNDNYDVQKRINFDSQFQNLLLDNSQIQESLYLEQIQQIKQKVSLTLKKSYSYNPFKFYVTSSLNFNYQNQFNYISTNSLDTISVIIQINSKIGKLIPKNQASIIFQISESQDQLQIQGTLENVNKVLQQQIIFANSSQINQSSQSIVQITVNDNINFPITKQFNIFECTFIVLKQQIVVNQHLNLQQQINQQFSDAVVDIETSISISFSSKTFIVEDTSFITYQTYFQGSDGEFVIIPPGLWLQQPSNDKLNFRGTTTSSLYGQIYRFQVKASDGYTTVVDQFTIQVKGIPFTYALNLIIKILGPLLGIIGVFKARFHFFNIIFQERVTFSQEQAECGVKYDKQLIIIDKQREDAKFIVRNLLKNIMQNKQFIQLKNMGNLFEKKRESIDQNENNFKDYQKFEQKKNFSFEKNKNQQYVQKVLSNLSKQKNNHTKSNLEKRYLSESGSLIMSKVIQDIISFNIRPETYKQTPEHQFINEIKDENSLIYRIIRALISRYLLKLDKKTQIIYEFIKFQCHNLFLNNKNDWYKAIVSIQYRKYQDKFKQGLNILPQLYFKYEQLVQILKQLITNEDKLDLKTPNTFDQLKNYINQYFDGVNIFLLREVLFADTFGFPQYKPSNFQPSVGLSIHINSQNISQIIAFKKRNINKYIRPFFKLFNNEYTKYNFSKNTRLPTWLSFNQKNGIIFLHGVPENQDIEEVLIRIYDTNKYVIQQFVINISLNRNRSQCEQNQTNDHETNNQSEQSKFLQTKIQSKYQKKPIIKRNIYSSCLIKDSKILQSSFISSKNINEIQGYRKSQSIQNNLKLDLNIQTIQDQAFQKKNFLFTRESNDINEELKELKSLSCFTPHSNSISQKQQQLLQVYSNSLTMDEINENK